MVNYKLKLPPNIRIYPVFYIVLLEPALENTRSIIEPVEFKEEKETFKVERILATRIIRNRV